MEPEEEYELHVNGFMEAGVCGPAAAARREILNYYNQYKDDGETVNIYRVFRQYEEIKPDDL